MGGTLVLGYLWSGQDRDLEVETLTCHEERNTLYMYLYSNSVECRVMIEKGKPTTLGEWIESTGFV